MDPTAFTTTLLALLVAHTVGDHWIQTTYQATHKQLPGWTGRIACATHVATYTATTTAFVVITATLFDLPLSPLGIAAGQVFSAVTHYWADRGTRTLEWLAETVGRGGFYRLGAPRDTYIPAVDTDGNTILNQSGEPALVRIDAPHVGTGAYQLDQAFHWAALYFAAVITVAVSAV